jgi:hypothetical protein
MTTPLTSGRAPSATDDALATDNAAVATDDSPRRFDGFDRSARATALNRFARWLIFGVLLALVPRIFSWAAREMRSQPSTLDVVLAKGELFLVTAAISGAAIGELVGVVRTTRQTFWEIVAGGCCLIVVVLSAHLFADVAAVRATAATVDPHRVRVWSLWLYFVGLVASGSSVAIS